MNPSMTIVCNECKKVLVVGGEKLVDSFYRPMPSIYYCAFCWPAEKEKREKQSKAEAKDIMDKNREGTHK